jgi:hypothetical protein
MRSTSSIRSVQAALTLLVAGATLGAPGAAAKPVRPRAPSLFAAAGYLFQVNNQQCGLTNAGTVCVAFAGSPVGGGGFWPKGTPDQYIFNSGLQFAGIIKNSPFPHLGGSDTVGAFFFDPRGDQGMGSGLSLVFSRLEPNDVAAWSSPPTKTVLDPNIYNSVLIGSDAISQGDVFVRYWEGDPTFLTGRTHPTGVAVDERVLAWNYPSGNEDIIYIIYTFYNVTARASSGKYNNPTIPVPLQAEIAAIGDQFQDINEPKFKVSIPDTGYTIDSMYVASGMDADVAVFDQNYATAFIPFSVGSEYSGTFLPEVGWQFPPAIFGPPFAAAPGFIGIKYLRSPTDAAGNQIGLTMFSQEVNSNSGFPDAVGVNQLYRYLSGYLGAGDNPCNPSAPTATVRARKYCYLGQQLVDARFYQASGPLSLPPGEARSIVVAYLNAAPYNGTGAPLVNKGGNTPPGTSGIGLTGIPTDSIRLIDQIAGWISSNDANGDGIISQNEVTVAPRSLLDKALKAQAVYDNGFLLPFAPDAPNFYLIPGDNQVSIVWSKSKSEETGDPFYAIASLDSVLIDPKNPGLGKKANPLFDPNFRKIDTEGYRIYRGRTSSALELVAQFDYSGTSFDDYTGAIDYGDKNGDGKTTCAPEFVSSGTIYDDTVPGGDCPVIFAANPIIGVSPHWPTELVGNIIQIPPGGRVQLATGSVLNLKADTAVIGVQCANVKCPALTNTGVPFMFVDNNVRNSFTYFYTVTAFDLNSVKSGPTSLESPRVTKPVTPRRSATNEAVAQLVSNIVGDDGIALDPTKPWSIDGATGRFSGTPPPTDGLAAAFAPLVQQLLPAVSLTATIDSLVAHADATCGVSNGIGSCYNIFVTFNKNGAKTPFQVQTAWPLWGDEGSGCCFDATPTLQYGLGALRLNSDKPSLQRFGIPDTGVTGDTLGQATASLTATLRQYINFSSLEGQAARRNVYGMGAGISPGGSRWYDGTDETVSHPTYSIRVGHVAGVDSIWAPIHHTDIDPLTAGVQQYADRAQMQCFSYLFSGLSRQADVQFTWGAGGTITAVRDLTHHVAEQFKPVPEATYGFIGDANGDGVISWDDFNYMEFVSQATDNTIGDLTFCNHVDPGAGARAQLSQQPIIMNVSTAGDPQLTPPVTGKGFGLYINGERYIFQLTGGNPPAAGTKWTLRTYSGTVTAANNPATTTPSGYKFSARTRSPIIPGLQVTFNVAAATALTAVEPADVLAKVHTVPDPYYVSNALEITANSKVLKFVNLPAQCLIRIYSLSGVLVNVVVHDALNSATDKSLGGEATWNLRNRNNQFVASGVYFYHIETPQGHTKVGRFTVVNFAP